MYAYAIGVVAGTLVQLLMTLPGLRKLGFPIWRLGSRAAATRSSGAC